MSFSADWLRAEQRRGHAAIAPEGAPWLIAEDWHVHALTRAAQEVRIVALWAKHPRQGAFRRLVAGIRAAGLTPVVVEPFGAMRPILQRWGWQPLEVDCEEQWRPPGA
jgi:hypothetical protein